MPELTEEQALELFRSEFWKEMTDHQIASFQLYTRRLCMPFDVFHKSMKEALGRPVFTHEFAFSDLLKAELRGEKPAPTFQEIVELIPLEKRVIVSR